ncbi:MAG TPA: AraC family transcriptional regulator [Allosphingosinicella sp.]|nr:AraC family transcriptional regulator [Allosphingosinicella sp.]
MGAVVAEGCEISRARTARHIARHHHLGAYAAVVLRGGYVEAGDRGRFAAAAGDVLLHDRFEAHQDQFGSGGADILNVPIAGAPDFAFGRIADPDALARQAERDVQAAGWLLIEQLEPADGAAADWPDLLASALREGEVADLASWARSRSLLPSSVSRGFRRCYGLSPKRFRLELRAARAARAAVRGLEPLAWVAAGAGFADQAHMCRTVKQVYGRAPSALRPAKSVQDGSPGPA